MKSETRPVLSEAAGASITRAGGVVWSGPRQEVVEDLTDLRGFHEYEIDEGDSVWDMSLGLARDADDHLAKKDASLHQFLKDAEDDPAVSEKHYVGFSDCRYDVGRLPVSRHFPLVEFSTVDDGESDGIGAEDSVEESCSQWRVVLIVIHDQNLHGLYLLGVRGRMLR